MFRSDEGPTLETLAVYYPYQQYTDLFIFRFVWLYSAYVVHYLYLTIMYFSLMEFLDEKYVYPIFILVIFIIHEMRNISTNNGKKVFKLCVVFKLVWK